MQSRNKVHTRKIHKAQTIIKLQLDLILYRYVKAVPLINGHHQRTSRIYDERQKRKILIGDVRTGVYDQQCHVTILNGLESLDYGEFFN